MPTINIDYQVFMTYSHEVTSNVTIGTDGLGPCIGIIATKINGNIFCGHLACTLAATPANAAAIKAQTIAVLAAQMGAKDEVENVYCASGQPNDRSSKWMMEAIVSAYSKTSFKQGSLIYWNGANPEISDDFNTTLTGTTEGPKDDSGPFEA
jgi:hypothetical protein